MPAKIIKETPLPMPLSEICSPSHSMNIAPAVQNTITIAFTWLLLYENPKDKAMAKTFNNFMNWMLTDGQKFAKDLGYAPLPAAVVKMEQAALAKIKVQ